MTMIHRDLRPFTYVECVECGSVHDMIYCDYNNSYECEECYRIESYTPTIDLEFNHREFIHFLRQAGPSASLRLIVRYMRWRGATDEEVYDREQIDAYYHDICSDSAEKQLFRQFP